MPDEGVTGWEDAVRGRIEFPNEQLEDVVIVRSDGRPTYNFASPVEDMDDAITHVIRGDDHISNTPKQIQILRALGHEPPVYAHVANILGTDGKKLSKRHGAVSVDEFRAAGYLADALVNFLALIGWAPDGETTIMSRDEIVERFSLEAVSASPGTFDYAKLDWMNGVYLRALDRAPTRTRSSATSTSGGSSGPRSGSGRWRRSCRRRSARLGEIPELHRVPVRATSSPTPSSSTRASCASAHAALEGRRVVGCRGDRDGPQSSCARSSARSRARSTGRSASRSRARACRRASTSPSSCSGGRRPSSGCAAARSLAA